MKEFSTFYTKQFKKKHYVIYFTFDCYKCPKHNAFQSGVNNDVSLAAYVVISLVEVENKKEVRNKSFLA